MQTWLKTLVKYIAYKKYYLKTINNFFLSFLGSFYVQYLISATL